MTKDKTYLRLHCVLYAVIAAMAAVGVCGCSDDDEGTPAVIAKDVVVSFRVVTESQPQTRAETPPPSENIFWGGEYDKEIGDDFDNTLLVEGFRVFVTDATCTERYAEVKSLLCTKSEQTVNDVTTITYNFVGEIDATAAQNLITAGKGKLHVVANMPDFTLPATGMGYDHTFTLSGQPGDNFKAIPMWGVHTVNNFADMANIGPNNQFDAGEVWLLRSMAKVEIVVDKSVRGNLTLTGAKMSNLNTDGYLLPNNHSAIKNTLSLNVSSTLNVKESLPATSSDFYPTEDGNTIIFYLPEIQNSEASRPSIELSYSFAGLEGYKTIQFGQYNEGSFNGSYYDIVRNHLYQFIVKRKAQETNLTINYTVCPWHTIDKIDIPSYD